MLLIPHEDQDESLMYFSWTISEITSQTVSFKVIFENPLYISIQNVSSRLFTHF